MPRDALFLTHLRHFRVPLFSAVSDLALSMLQAPFCAVDTRDQASGTSAQFQQQLLDIEAALDDITRRNATQPLSPRTWELLTQRGLIPHLKSNADTLSRDLPDKKDSSHYRLKKNKKALLSFTKYLDINRFIILCCIISGNKLEKLSDEDRDIMIRHLCIWQPQVTSTYINFVESCRARYETSFTMYSERNQALQALEGARSNETMLGQAIEPTMYTPPANEILGICKLDYKDAAKLVMDMALQGQLETAVHLGVKPSQDVLVIKLPAEVSDRICMILAKWRLNQ